MSLGKNRFAVPPPTRKIDWELVAGLPLHDYDKGTRDASLLDDNLIGHAIEYRIDETDPHFSDPRYTVNLARLFRIFLAKCDFDATLFYSDKEDQSRIIEETREELEISKGRIRKLLDEKVEASTLIQSLDEGQQALKNERAKDQAKIQALNDEIHAREKDLEKSASDAETLRKDLNRITRERDDLRRANEIRDSELSKSDADHHKVFLEHQTLVLRFKDAADKLAIANESLSKLDAEYRERTLSFDAEMTNLRAQLQVLQQENVELTASRNKAEELCERREAQALQDMTELQNAYKEVVSEEQRRYEELKEDYLQMRNEFELRDRNRASPREIEERDEQISALRRELHLLKHSARQESSDDDSVRSSLQMQATNSNIADERNLSMINSLIAQRQRLEQELEELKTEYLTLENRCEKQDSDNLKLRKLLDEYDRGDAGLRTLREELNDLKRNFEMSQTEAQQLRERLASMEDVAALCTSLKALCRRFGVTQEEIDKLQGGATSRFSELETLRQETIVLKEEINWLEKERKYWMNKVRLQPLLDTKLRFELGLSSEQMKQLDIIAEKMKSSKSVVVYDTEERNENETVDAYQERLIQAQKKRIEELKKFNDAVRVRIEEVLGSLVSNALGGIGDQAGNAIGILEEIRQHAAAAAAAGNGFTIEGTTASLLQQPAAPHQSAAQNAKQLETMQHKLAEVEKLNQDLLVESGKSRDRIAGLEATLAATTEERNMYRSIFFDASANAQGESQANVQPPSINVGLLTTQLPSVPVMHPSPFRRPVNDLAPILKEQLRTKELRLEKLSAEFDTLRATMEAEKERVEALKGDNAVLSARVKSLGDQAISLTATLQMSADRISELEKINIELHNGLQRGDLAPSMKELLQKIVLLRQREAKLVQRLRIVTTERDEACASEEKQEKSILATLKTMKEMLEGTTPGIVLPPAAPQFAAETEALRVLQLQLSELSEGRLFAEDVKYLAQLRETVDQMDSATELASVRSEARNTKHQMEEALFAAHDKIGELEGMIARLRGSGQTESSSATFEVEANTWRQRCSLYTKRLADRDADVIQVEEQLSLSRQQVVECKEEIRRLHDLLSNSTSTAGGAGAPTLSLPSSVSASPDALLKLEREIARQKSLNIGLLQNSIDLQGEKKKLQVMLQSANKHLQLTEDLQKSEDGKQDKVISEFVITALKDSSNLQQQVELAQYQVKKLRLQLLTSESNFRTVANEAAAYKLSAHRLFKAYAENVVKIVDSTRQLKRNVGSSLSARRSEALYKRVALSLALAEQEHRRFEQESQRSVELRSQVAALQDECELLGSISHGGSPAGSAQRAVSEVEKAKLIELRAQLRTVQRQFQQACEERDFVTARLTSTEALLAESEKEIARLESGDRGLADAEDDDSFLEKLIELKESVFSKSEAPPIAISMSPSSVLTGAEGDGAVREFKEALDKQASLSKQCSQLQHDLTNAKQHLALTESRCTALREELHHAQQSVLASAQQLESEKQKAGLREERLIAAHSHQLEVSQRAVEHNTQCLKDLLSGKERTIQQLQQQLKSERDRYLEHQLLDTTRMERLHEQLFKENNAMMERFKQTMDDSATGNAGSQHVMNLSTISSSAYGAEAAHSQVQALTQETQQLRLQVKELRGRNIMLETQLNDQINAGQEQIRELMNTRHSSQGAQLNDMIEQSLMAVNKDREVTIDNLRRREHELLTQLQQNQDEAKRLQSEVFDLRNKLIEQADMASRTTQHMIMKQSLDGAQRNGDVIMHQHQQELTPSIANELRTQLAAVETQLREAKAQLAYEKAHVQHATSQSEEWKKSMELLSKDLAQGTVHVEQARNLMASNQQLRQDLDAMKEQNERLVSATTSLKQKLVEQAQHANSKEQQMSQEIAIAQRMAVIQQESAENIRSLQARVASIQHELQLRVGREEELLRKGKAAQSFSEEQHRQLLLREKEVIMLKREMQHLQRQHTLLAAASGKSPIGSKKGRDAPISWKDAEVQTITSEIWPQAWPNPMLPAGFAGYPASPQGAVPSYPQPIPLSQPPAGIPIAPQAPDVAVQPVPPPVAATASSNVQPPAALPPQEDARPPTATMKKKSSSPVRKTTASSLPEGEVLPHVAGVVSRQVLAMQKEKQQEIDNLRAQVRKLESEVEDFSQKLVKEKSLAEAKVSAAQSALNQLKAKYEQLESSHRQEILKFLEEKRKAEAVVKPKLSTRIPTTVMKEQSVQATPEPVSQPIPLPIAVPVASTVTAGPGVMPPVAVAGSNVVPSVAGPLAPSLIVLPQPIVVPVTSVASVMGGTPVPAPTAATTPSISTAAPACEKPATVSVKSQTEVGNSDFSQLSVKGQDTKKWVELQTATSDLKIQETIRRIRKDNEKLTKKLEELQTTAKEAEQLRTTVKARDEEIVQLRGQLVQCSGGVGGDAQVASPIDFRAHKREMIKLEEFCDQLRRDINVKKEVELREFMLTNDRLTRDVQRLEAENAALRGVCAPSSTAPSQPSATFVPEPPKVRELENKLLEQEGLLLDLRFERETLLMKVTRLEKHLSDIMRVDAVAQSTATAAGNAGASRKTKGSGKDVVALEQVIESMKNVIERQQHENMSLKSTAVSSAQFMEAMKEVKDLRHREREMLQRIHEQHKKIQELQAAVLPGSKLSEQYAALQRRLRMTQATADQYQLELLELRTRLGEAPVHTSSNAHSAPSSRHASSAAEASIPTLNPISSSAANAYAPENHSLLSHHSVHHADAMMRFH